MEENSMGENAMEFTIIIVDDEEMILKSLESFLTLATDYIVKTFLSPAEALEYIKNNDVDLVISDYLMPDMDGLSFLEEVKKLRPEVPRIILTGYADKENAIKAINVVGLYHYIEKPWNNDELLIVIRNGLARSGLVRDLKRKIKEINDAYRELEDLQIAIMELFV
jgi:DNA-binding NtrC family response regulator